MGLPFSSLTTWAHVLNHPGVAQDIVISLLLPFVNATYGSVAWLLVFGLVCGLIYVGFRMLFEGRGEGIVGYFLSLLIVTACLIPIRVSTSNSILFHAGTYGPGSGLQVPQVSGTYTVPAGFYYLTGATNAIEDYLYAVIDQGNSELAAGGVAYSGIPLDAYTVLDDNYAAALKDPDLISLYNTYQAACRYTMMDAPLANKYNVQPSEWYGVGFMSSGILGTIGSTASTGHHIISGIQHFWVTNPVVTPFMMIDSSLLGNVQGVSENYNNENINIDNAMLALANSTPVMDPNALNAPFKNVQIKGTAYWKAVYDATPLPSNPYVEVPTSYWVGVTDPKSGSLLGTPTVTENTGSNGVKHYLYSATNCLQMMNLVNTAFRFMRNGLNEKYDVESDCYDGGACSGDVANAKMASATVAQLMASEAFMHNISKAQSGLLNGDVPYQYNGTPTNGQSNFAVGVALNYKSMLSDLGIWMSKYFKVPMICVAAISVLALLVGLMMVISPFVIALATLPGRFGMLVTYFQMLIFMKLTVWVMYLIFIVGGYVSSVLLAATVAGQIGNLSGAAAFAATALSSQSLVVVGVLFGAPKIAYMLVFNRSHYLQQGMGQGSVQEMSDQGKAVIDAAVEAAATAAMLLK